MKNKCKSILYDLDLIGQTPQLYIFGNKRYKSSISSFISIILIVFSFSFTLYSIVLYFKFSSPNVNYSKSSDDDTNRAIYLKDTFLMFQLVETNSGKKIDDSMVNYQGDYVIIYDNGTIFTGELYVEKCDFEKNINYRHKDILKTKMNFGRPIEEFYCFSSKSGNTSLFYNPNIGYSIININIFLNSNTKYAPETIASLVINENNIIDHNNKEKPIGEGFVYHTSSGFSSSEYTEIKYTIQYVKYESDNGFFFPDNKNFKGISFSSMTSVRWKQESYDFNFDLKNKNFSNIGKISFEISKSNYDNYKRSYKKIQALLAETMSVISILLEIGKQISIILCNKKMSKDIITYISLSNKRNENQINNINLSKYKENIDKISERKEMKYNHMNKTDNNDYNDKKNSIINFSKSEIILENNNKNSYKNRQILQTINFCHILKSYFCFKDKRAQLVNICDNIITEDICIERFLKRIYDLENIDCYLANKEKEKVMSYKNKRFQEINKYLDIINKEEKENRVINRFE